MDSMLTSVQLPMRDTLSRPRLMSDQSVLSLTDNAGRRRRAQHQWLDRGRWWQAVGDEGGLRLRRSFRKC